jgi:antitoxin (DNA-binding transcriptional repressor) of toxin-antitoxin stability system
MSIRAARIAAVLAPGTLLLHQLAYAVAGGGLAGPHHYLEVLAPLALVGAASLALGSLLPSALGRGDGRPQPFVPLALAAALLGIFIAQESVEAALLGGGSAGLAASLSVAWLAPPLALLLGAIGGGLLIALDRAGRAIAAVVAARATRPRRPRPAAAPASPSIASLACSGLSFGFARRPPPMLA